MWKRQMTSLNIHHSETSRKDATTDALLVRNRLQLGHDDNLSRPKRKYDKTDLDFFGKKEIKY